MSNTDLKFYVADSTLKKGSQTPVFIYDSTAELVRHLEGTVFRQFNKTRARFMEDAADMGVAEDDNIGRAFTELLTEYFNIGFIKNNVPIRKNIFEADHYLRRTDVHGD
jgi:hypothetical protein